MLSKTRRDRARLLRCQPRIEPLERRDLLSWSPELVTVAEFEPNDVITEAQDVGPVDFAQGVRVRGAIGTPTDVDFYQFEVDEATAVTVKLSGTGIATLYENDPTAAPLGHPQLLQLGAGASETINLLAGTYEIAVSGLGDRYFSPVLADSGTAGTPGPYALTITGDNPTFNTKGAVSVVRTDIPTGGYTSSPLAIHITLTQPLDLVHDYVTIVDAQQNDYSPTVTFDPVSSDLVLTPASALGVGHYQVIGIDSTGNLLFDLPFAVSGRKGQSAAARTNDTLATATPLADLTHAGLVQVPGVIGADPYYTPWNSDPGGTDPANQVEMYSFTISGPGTQVLSAEVFAGRIGSPLNPALTLFRVTGKNPDGTPAWQLVAGNNKSYNPTAAVNDTAPLYNDPVLFAGLTAGYYVIAVSAFNNYGNPLLGLVPGTGGIFDPDRSHSASGAITPPGPYVLNLRVQPASPTPPQVVSTSLAPGAVLTGPPTQFTVQFSAPVNLVQLAVLSGQQWQLDTFSGNIDPAQLQRFPVFIEDAAGNRDPLALSSYDQATGSATFTLLNRVADGTYTLHLSGPGGLTDLAGTPLTGNDSSGDYVVPFTVTDSPAMPADRTLTNGSSSVAAPVDLGVLFPTELAAGVSVSRDFRTADPAPAGTADYYQFTLLQEAGLVVSLGGPGLNATGRPVLLDTQGNPLYSAIRAALPGRQGVNLLLPAGTYVIMVGGWRAVDAANAVYTLHIVQSSQPENPTPLTTGPAPAVQLRLDTLAAATPPSAGLVASSGPVPQLTLPSPATPSITLTLDRSGASSVLPGATPLVGIASNLAAGPAGVVGSAGTTNNASVRLILPGSEFPLTTVATTADPPTVSAGTRLGPTPPQVTAVSAGLQALVLHTLDWLWLSPLTTQPMHFEAEPDAPAEALDPSTAPVAVAEPTNTTAAASRLTPALWAAGLALLACFGAEPWLVTHYRDQRQRRLSDPTPRD